MAESLKDVRQILTDARSELLEKPNVVAVGVGYKKVDGQTTDQLALMCSVDVKMARAKLSSSELLPASIQNVPTDVHPTGLIRAMQEQTGRYRPAPGGVSIGHFRITAGTLGCLVKKNNQLYILSNNHVLANSNDASIGDLILQPGPYDGGQSTTDQIAHLTEFVEIKFEGSSTPCFLASGITSVLNALAAIFGSKTRLSPTRPMAEENLVDCALALPIDAADVLNEILQIGAIAGVAEGTLGMSIKKSGRTTGLTTGTIEQIDVTSRVSYGTNKIALFTDQLMAGAMSQGGDSGSAVINSENKLVGLLFAGSDTTTIFNRVQNVFQLLSVTLP